MEVELHAGIVGCFGAEHTEVEDALPVGYDDELHAVDDPIVLRYPEYLPAAGEVEAAELEDVLHAEADDEQHAASAGPVAEHIIQQSAELVVGVPGPAAHEAGPRTPSPSPPPRRGRAG
eukprot:13471342-Alexandrium_andersonii.AAC.1